MINNKPNLVLDSNCWLDLLVFYDPSVNLLRHAIESKAVIALVCEPMRQEMCQVLSRPWICRDRDADAVMIDFDRLGTMRSIPATQRLQLACADQDDQIFLDLAIEQKASYLVSKDRQLLRLAKKSLQRFQLAILRQDSLAFQQCCRQWSLIGSSIGLGQAENFLGNKA